MGVLVYRSCQWSCLGLQLWKGADSTRKLFHCRNGLGASKTGVKWGQKGAKWSPKRGWPFGPWVKRAQNFGLALEEGLEKIREKGGRPPSKGRLISKGPFFVTGAKPGGPPGKKRLRRRRKNPALHKGGRLFSPGETKPRGCVGGRRTTFFSGGRKKPPRGGVTHKKKRRGGGRVYLYHHDEGGRHTQVRGGKKFAVQQKSGTGVVVADEV